MKTLFVAIILVLSLAQMPVYAAVEVGKPAPQFSAKNTKGDNISLSDLKGKIVVLEWTNHECPFVRKHYKSGNIQEMQKSYIAKDVVWISIVSSAEGKQGFLTPAESDKVVKEQDAAPSHKILDASGAIGKQYDAKTTPHIFIIDKAGNIAYQGAVDDVPSASPNDVKGAKNYVRDALDALLDNKNVAEPVTTPYGCSVKYQS